MTRFFGPRRLNFIRLRKLKRYLFYSVGEILLVVIGILIAFSIDNWNEARKDREKEQHILIQLKKEYQSNLVQIEEKISTREAMINASHQVLNYIDDPARVNRDSLMARLALLLNDPTFDPIVNDLFVSGNIRLIQNEELKGLLTNWSSEVIAVQEVEKRWAKLVDELIVPSYAEMGIARDALDVLYRSDNPAPFALEKPERSMRRLGMSSRPPGLEKILTSGRFEGIVSVSIGLNNSANLQSQVLKRRIVNILRLIDQEIETQEGQGR